MSLYCCGIGILAADMNTIIIDSYSGIRDMVKTE